MNDEVRSRLEALEQRQEHLRRQLAALEEDLAELKYGPPAPPAVAAPPIADTEAGPPPEPPAPAIQSLPAPAPPQAAPVPPPLPPPPPAQKNSLEMKVGTVWLARIGIVILLTGLVFLGNYAWQSLVEHFGSIAKLAVLYLAGSALCTIGLLLERKRPALKSYSGILIAGGLASIYYTTYAAHYIPSLKVIASPLAAGLLLVGLAGAIGWVADRRNSQSTAALAILLAFYASAVNPLTYFTLFSNALLGLAAVFLMVRRRWLAVPFLALAATYWSYLYWRIAENWKFWEASGTGDADVTVRLVFLSIYWMVFTAGIFVANRPGVSAAVRVVFSTLNDAAFFSLAALAISGNHHDRIWIVALVFGLVQFALSLGARRVHGPDTPLAAAWLAKALFFLTLAILIRCAGDSLGIILAVECSLLVFAASRFPSRVLAAAGPLAGMLALVAGLFALDGSARFASAGLTAALLLGNAWFCRRPVFSIRALLLSMSGVALGSAVLIHRLPDSWEGTGLGLFGLALVAGLPLHKCRELSLAALVASIASALGQFAALDTTGFWPSIVALGLLVAIAVTGPLVAGGDKVLRIPSGILAIAATLIWWLWVNRHVSEGHQFWLIAFTAAVALAFSRERPLRQAVSVILTVAAFLIFLNHGIGSNVRFTPLDFLGCLLLLGQERLARFVNAPAGMARFAGIAGLLSLFAWVTSAVGFYHDPIPLTAAWAVLALAVFFAGFLLRSRIFRLGGLAILAIALLRIALFDVWRLELPFRIFSFLALGSVLLVLGYLYNRYEEKIRRWL